MYNNHFFTSEINFHCIIQILNTSFALYTPPLKTSTVQLLDLLKLIKFIETYTLIYICIEVGYNMCQVAY